MRLNEFAKKKALDFIEGVIRQAHPDARTEVGSTLRQLKILPGALIHAALFQEFEGLRRLFLGNASSISEGDMDLLSGNLLQNRPRGSRAVTNLKVYLEEPLGFSIKPRPYFSTAAGTRFRPVKALSFGVGDIRSDEGEFFVYIPVISESYGESSRAGRGEISQFDNFPAPVKRVTNPNPTAGGEARLNNAQYFEHLQQSLHNPTLLQPGGLVDFIQTEYRESGGVEIVTAGDVRMRRDEVWKDTNDLPNLGRVGEPWAQHTDLGTLDFDTTPGRAVSTTDIFESAMEGARIAVDGDVEKFRLIRRVVNPKEAVVSGHPLSGVHEAVVWGDAPHIHVMSDVYTYFPTLEVRSAVVDKVYRLEVDGDFAGIAGGTISKNIQVRLPQGVGYPSLPSSGRAVFFEGTANEVQAEVVSIPQNNQGTYLQMKYNFGPALTDGGSVHLYDMGRIETGEDITALPAVYVLRVDSLDPTTLQPDGQIPQSAPGKYDDPGWYWETSQPSEIFSAREKKTLIIDDKTNHKNFQSLSKTADVSALEDWSTGLRTITDKGTQDELEVAGEDFSGMAGREFSFTLENTTLNDGDDDVAQKRAVVDHGGTALYSNDLNTRYFTSIGYRYRDVEVLVEERDSDGLLVQGIGEYTGGVSGGDKVVLFGGFVEKAEGQFPPLSDDIANHYSVSVTYYNPSESLHDHQPELAHTTESVVLRGSGETLEMYLGEFGAVADKNGVVTHAEVSFESEYGDFATRPARVTYATHSGISEIQDVLDDSSFRGLCEDTLSRTMLPTLLDVAIEYKGGASTENVQARFYDLLQEALAPARSGRDVRIDVSNIISAIGEEGLADEVDVRPEIRVTNFLPDGEFEVRYINPHHATRQKLAIDAAASSGDNTVVLRRLDSTAPLPGRGKIFMGGNNPDAQEALPFEGVIERDGVFTVILRSGHTLSHDHGKWEGVWVGVRDFDPSMEFTEGAIEIPSVNRPYIRQLLMTQKD